MPFFRNTSYKSLVVATGVFRHVAQLGWPRQLGAVAGAGIKAARAGKIKAHGLVGVGKVDGLAGVGGVGRNQGVVGPAVGGCQRQIVKLAADGLPAGATQGDAQRFGADDGKTQVRLIGGQQVERATVGVGDGFGGQQDLLEQAVEVPLAGQGHADGVELFEPLNQTIHAIFLGCTGQQALKGRLSTSAEFGFGPAVRNRT